MDRFKGFDNFNFISKNKTNVKQFIASWTARLESDSTFLNSSRTSAEETQQQDCNDLSLPVSTVQRIHSFFRRGSKSKFDPNEQSVINLLDSEHSCRSFEHTREHCEKMTTSLVYRNQNCVKHRLPLCEQPMGSQHHETDLATNIPLAMLTIQVYRQFLPSNRPKVALEREYLVLSCQPLTVLRDVFTCVTDLITIDDHSENPLQEFDYDPSAKSSGFFLIDDVLYNDTRNEIVSLHPMVEWMSKRLGARFEEKIMADARFEDLEIRLGAPYLYVHAANCEHLFSVTDISYVPPSSLGNNAAKNYPVCTRNGDGSRLKCQMCVQHLAKWLVIENKRLPMPRYYFCHNCFILFNYDGPTMNKIGSFKAYPLRLNCRDNVALPSSVCAD